MTTKWRRDRNKRKVKKRELEAKIAQNSNPKKLNLSPLQTLPPPTKKEQSKIQPKIKPEKSSDITENKTVKLIFGYILSIIEIFKNLSDYINLTETKFSRLLAQLFSKNTNSEKDVSLIKKNLVMFLNVVLSSYIVYSAYFVMFLRDSNGKMETFDFSLENLKESNSIVHFFFKYILCTLSIMITTLKVTIPYIVESRVGDRQIHFLSLFVIVLIIVSFMGFIILDSPTNPSFIAVYSVLFIMYGGYSMLSDFIPKNGSLDMLGIRAKYTALGAYTPIFIFIIFALRILFSVSMSMLTAFINCLYLIYFAFFTLPIFTLFSKVREIDDYILSPQINVEDDSDKSLMSRIIDRIISILFEYTFEIAFLIVFVSGTFDYSLNMKNTPQLQGTLIFICTLFILFTIILIYQKYTAFKRVIKVVNFPKENTSTETSEGLMGNVSKGLMGNVSKGLMGNVSKGLMGNVSKGLMGNVSKGLMGNVSKGLMGNVSKGLMGNVSKGLMGNVSKGLMGNIPKGLTDNIPKGLTDNIPKGLMDNIPEGLMDNIPKGLTDNITKGLTDNIPKGLVDNIPKGLTDNISKGLTDNITKGLTDNISKGLTDNITKGLTDNITKGLTDNITKKLTDNIPKGLTDNIPKGIMDNIPKGLMDNIPKGLMDNIPKGLMNTIRKGRSVL
jgi:hypothetical protein